MLKRAGHAVDLGRVGTHRLGSVTPSRGHGRNLFDDRACLRQRETKELRRSLKEVKRAGAFVEVDVGRQQPRLKISWRGIEIISRRERPSRLSQPEETVLRK